MTAPDAPGKPRASVPLHPNVRGLGLSATLAIQALCDRLQADGRRVYRLGLGQSPFPVPLPLVEELRASAARKEYLPVCGLPALREAVADYHRRRTDLPATAADVIVGPGSKELMFLLQVAYDGQLVVPTPAWVSYAPQARIVGRPVCFLPARREDGWRLRPEALDALGTEEPGRARIVILNYPSNPTGGTYAPAELRALAEVARRHGVVLLSDEIYGELHHRGEHVSVARFYPEGTIISSGLSKWCGAGGWRLGTFTFPREMRWLLEAMAAVASETYTSTSTPIQCAAVRAFEGGIVIERYLRNARRILGALGSLVAERLHEAGADVDPPVGGFYLFPDFAPQARHLRQRGITTGAELCAAILRDTGVALLPGSDFGRPPEELTARLAYVDFDGARALAAAEARPPDEAFGGEFVETYCAPMVEAADHLRAWFATFQDTDTAPARRHAPAPA